VQRINYVLRFKSKNIVADSDTKRLFYAMTSGLRRNFQASAVAGRYAGADRRSSSKEMRRCEKKIFLFARRGEFHHGESRFDEVDVTPPLAAP
jgi:hypothetical protein